MPFKPLPIFQDHSQMEHIFALFRLMSANFDTFSTVCASATSRFNAHHTNQLISCTILVKLEKKFYKKLKVFFTILSFLCKNMVNCRF